MERVGFLITPFQHLLSASGVHHGDISLINPKLSITHSRLHHR